MGELPVGRPSTKGFVGVGLNSMILSMPTVDQHVDAMFGALRRPPFGDVVCNIVAHCTRIISNDETCM